MFYVLITELILMGCLTYVAYRYTNLVESYNKLEALLDNYKAWLDNSDKERAKLEDALSAAYRTIDRMQDERDGTSFADEIGECIHDLECDDCGCNVDPETGFTYNLYASDAIDISVDRIQWTPQDLYTPDVNGSDEF